MFLFGKYDQHDKDAYGHANDECTDDNTSACEEALKEKWERTRKIHRRL